ncbi:MAG: sulfatase [Planctomycetales bacterium]|nr:sulfatase [Planctomycetales bacterium]
MLLLAVLSGCGGASCSAANDAWSTLFVSDFPSDAAAVGPRRDVGPTPSRGELKEWIVAEPATASNERTEASWFLASGVATQSQQGPASTGWLEHAAATSEAIAYCRTMIPATAHRFAIEFRLRPGSEERQTLVLGAAQPRLSHDGWEKEIGCAADFDAAVDGRRRSTRERDASPARHNATGSAWQRHRVEVDGQRIVWRCDEALRFSGSVDKTLRGGYFGFRLNQGVGTRIDDVRVTAELEEPGARPNVLFIAVDDLRCDLGCYGNDAVQSPAIDRLAKSGVLFRRAYCQYPLCNPSRTSVLTGLRPDANGANRTEANNRYHFRSKLPDCETLPQMFQRGGYRVERVGKLYHYGVPREIGTESAMDDRPSWQRAFYPRGLERDEESLLINYTPDRSSGWGLCWHESSVPAAQHTDGMVCDAAASLLDDYAASKSPFFLAVGFYRPHVPATAPREFFAQYPLQSIRLPSVESASDSSVPSAARDPRYEVEAANDDLTKFKRAHYASISFVDQQIGRLLQRLDDAGLASSTIVVLWSDHGWMLGEMGLWTKPYLFEECARTPLIVRVPGMRGPGASCDQIVELVDLYPTLAQLCRLAPPQNLAGRSLQPLCEDPDLPWECDALTQMAYGSTHGYSLRTDQWRYTEWDDGRAGRELYRFENDFVTRRNVVDDDEWAGVVAELAERLRSKRQTATLPPQKSGPRRLDDSP